MKSKKFSVMVGIIFCALLAQAQDTSSDANWDSDPLDVIEPQKNKEEAPSLPEFEEIPDASAAEPSVKEAAPPVQDVAVPPPSVDVATPTPAPVPAASTTGAEAPDYSKETRFHNIYKSYNEQPTSEETWEQAVATRKSEKYEVQKGDTLSGISTTFFGDPFFWPKIWSLNNSKILNPHEIKPGLAIQFYPGSLEDAPTLQLGKEEAAPAAEEVVTATPKEPEAAGAEAEAVAKSEEGQDVAKLIMPPPLRKRSPVLRNLPNSLPSLRNGVNATKPVIVEIDLPQRHFAAPVEYLSYYVAEAPIQGAGKISSAEGGMKIVGEYQNVYVQLNDGAGKHFVVQKNVGPVVDPANKKRQAQMIEVQGEIEVLEKVNSEKNIYRAVVKKIVHPVEVGAVLTPGKIPMFNTAVGPATSNVGAKIMGGQFDKKRNIFGSNSLIFLDQGKSQGLQEGQLLSIFADERNRDKKTESLENDRVIGSVKVVGVTENFATGYIIKTSEDVSVGDYVGKYGSQAKMDSPVIESSSATPEVSGDTNFEEDFGADVPSEGSAPEPGAEEPELELE